MEASKKLDDLDEIRKRMPEKYAVLIATEINEPDFDAEAVRRVFRKQSTRPEKVLKVLTAAKKVIDKQKQIQDLQQDIASSLA